MFCFAGFGVRVWMNGFYALGHIVMFCSAYKVGVFEFEYGFASEGSLSVHPTLGFEVVDLFGVCVQCLLDNGFEIYWFLLWCCASWV